jgi:ElaB/YqjD/DUF883 family membrane-anchored ribosome-binding protein
MDEGTTKMSTANWDEERTTSTQDNDSYIASGSADVDYAEDTEQIRADIEDTRAEMSQTINEIQERLSPENIVGQVKETVREATIGKVERAMERVGETLADVTEPAMEYMGRAGTTIKETGRSVGNSIWKNPIPVALIGLGVGMLCMRKFGRAGNGYDYETTSSRASKTRRSSLMGQTQPTTGQSYQGSYQGSGSYRGSGSSQGSYQGTSNTLGQVKETASDLAHRSTETLSNLGTKAKDSASALGTRFNQMLQQNPLAVGAVAVAAGTAVGLLLPTTEFEQEYIGETGEMLVDRAEDVARGALDKVQSAAEQMTSENQPGT